MKVTDVSDNKIQLEFGNHGDPRQAVDGDDLSLLVTMTIQMGCHDDLVLKNVKVSSLYIYMKTFCVIFGKRKIDYSNNEFLIVKSQIRICEIY